jgi:hypothetical protein
VEDRYIKDKGFSFSDEAKVLLSETIGELTAGKQFNGFKSVNQLAGDILYNILTTDVKSVKEITAEMLSGYEKDSPYVKQRVKGQDGTKKIIGFTERGR